MTRVLIGYVGQSNNTEIGGAPDRTANGWPTRDTSRRSMYPRLSSLAWERSRAYLHALRTAVGATSLSRYWVGCAKPWAAGFVQQGQYATYNGRTWKATTPNTAAPSAVYGVSSLAPTSTAGADNVQWQDMGVATAKDLSGKVYDMTDTGRFDPNGKLAALLTQLLSLPGWDKRIAHISIGQQEKAYNTSITDWTDALVNAATYFASNQIIASIGYTCIGRTANSVGWERDVGDPGVELALSALRGNTRVIRGANLYRGLASNPLDPWNTNLQVEAAPYSTAPGLQSESGANVHLNDAALYIASELEWAALQAAGVFDT